MRTDYKLTSEDELTAMIKHSGIETWNELIDFVKKLQYGRHTNRTDFGLVITKKKGSCSSKHALLKKVADLNKIENIKLILGIYRMTETNTPKIGTELTENSINFIPEAHCYLQIDHKRIDITTDQSDFTKIEKDIITELEIEPEQVAEFKFDYHKQFLVSWVLENQIDQKFDEIWEIREKCIAKLNKTTHNAYNSLLVWVIARHCFCVFKSYFKYDNPNIDYKSY